VEADLEALVADHHPAPAPTDPQIDVSHGHGAALGRPPALDQLGRGAGLIGSDGPGRCIMAQEIRLWRSFRDQAT
jgi:hypothetical protein